MIKHIVSAILLALPAMAAAAPVLREASSLGFLSKQMGVPVRGEFKRFEADVVFDPKDLKKSRASIAIDLDSIDAGSDEATAEIKRKAWLDVKGHPKADFVSTSLERVGTDKYVVTGRMTIKGRAMDVSAPFLARRQKDAWVFDGGFTIKRLDFEIGEGAWSDTGTVANEVEMSFKFHLPDVRKK